MAGMTPAAATVHHRLRRLGRALLAAATVALAACSPAYQPPLMVGANTWIGYEPLFLAREQGWLDGHNLRLVELASSSQTMDALRAGQLDLAGLTLDEVLTLQQEGVPLVAIWVLNVSNGADAVVARKRVPDLQALLGQRIGVEQTALGAFVLDAALRQAGLRSDEVRIVALPIDEHLGAWRSGQVDALVTFDPIRQALLQEGGHDLFDSRAMPDQIVDVLVARPSALQCCSARIAALLAGQQRALRHLQTQPQAAQAQIAQRLGLQPQDIARSLAHVELPNAHANTLLLRGPEPALARSAEHLGQLMQERGLLAAAPHGAQLFDARFTPSDRP